MKQSRLDQLSDGIFAIVMTILVFELRIPAYSFMTDGILTNSLVNMYPLFLSYLLSFSLLFTYWRSHHLIASVLARNIDIRFSNINGIFLFFVALVPFSSSLLGQYPNLRMAILVFVLNIILLGWSLFRMRNYAVRSQTIENTPFTKREKEHANMHILFPVASAIVAIAISFISTHIAILIFTIAILFNLSSKGVHYTFLIIDLFRKKENRIETTL